MDHKTDTDAGRAALEAYLKDCDRNAIVPDVGGAFFAAFQAGRASLAASAGSEPTKYVNELLRSALVGLMKAEERAENLSVVADTYACESARFAMHDAMEFARKAIAYVPENPQHDSDCSLHNEPAFPAGPCDCSVSVTHPSPPEGMGGWISLEERLPEVGVTVLVYEPFRHGEDWPGTVRISFDHICPDYEDWHDHCASYEHFMAVGGANACGPDVTCAGPSEKAPYTHWMPLPAPPIAAGGGKDAG